MFLSPIFLYGLALIGVPILIHLIRKRKIKVIQWAAMEFLLLSQKKQKKRLRIEELLLLLLRICIVALAVFAFARPVLRAIGIPLLSQNARVYAVIVLDNSFSMGQKGADGKTSFERAQSAADEIAANILKSGDSASVVLLSDKPEDLIGDPSFDLKLVRQKIHGAKLSDRGTDNLETAKRVNRLLKISTSPVREVYFLSDDQASAWETSKRDSGHTVWGEMGKMARITWVSVGGKDTERDNLAVETPTLGRQLVTPQIPATFDVKIHNFGTHPRQKLPLSLFVDGVKRSDNPPAVTIQPNGSATARFSYKFTKAGTHTGRVEINDPQNADNLPRDNSAAFALRSRDQLKILVSDAHPARDPAKSESFYLMTALAPGGESESMVPKLRENANFSGVELRDYDAVVLTGASGLSAGDAKLLADYVKTGGGLLIYPGPFTDAGQLNSVLGGAGLLPAKLGTRRTLDEEDAVSLNAATVAHPALSLFKDTSTLNIGTARFLTYYPLTLTEGTDPNALQVMLRFTNGDSAFVERKVGRGKVILAASGAGTNWNQLALKGAYVPMLYQMISYLGMGPTSSRNLRQNEPFSLALPLEDANKPVKITRPDGKTATQNSQMDAGGVSFVYNDTGAAGIYTISVVGSKTTDAFAVGLPTDESNLAVADPRAAAIESGVPGGVLTVATSPSQLQTSVRKSRYGTEIWRPFIWAVLALMFLESLLANLFGRRG